MAQKPARNFARLALDTQTRRDAYGLRYDSYLASGFIEPNETFEWVEPQAGAVCFLRIRTDVDIDRFYRVLFEEHGTYVGGGHWFDQDRRFFRVGFAWPTTEELARGLRTLDEAAAAALRPTPSSLSR